MGLGMVFPIAIVLGFFLGRWLGGRLGHPKLGMAVGLVWGAATGFWELYKVTVRLNRLDSGADGEQAGEGEGHPGGDDETGR